MTLLASSVPSLSTLMVLRDVVVRLDASASVGVTTLLVQFIAAYCVLVMSASAVHACL